MKRSLLFLIPYLTLGLAAHFYHSEFMQDLAKTLYFYLFTLNAIAFIPLVYSFGKSLVKYEINSFWTTHFWHINWYCALVTILCLLLFDGVFSLENVLIQSHSSEINYWLLFTMAVLSGYSSFLFFIYLANIIINLSFVSTYVGFYPDINIVFGALGVSIYLLSIRFSFGKALSRAPKSVKNRILLGANFIVALFYFLPGLGKILISPNGYEWFATNDFGSIIASSCNFGWQLSCESLPFWLALRPFYPVINFLVLAMELASIVLLTGQAVVYICIVRVVFHLITIFSGGDLFAGFIIINAGLAILNWKIPILIGYDFRWKKRVGLLLAGLVFLAVNFSTPLYWFDIAVNNKYQIYVTGFDKTRYPVNYNLWGQFSSFFLYDVFPSLQPQGARVLQYGVGETTSFATAIAIKKLKSVEEFQSQKNEFFESNIADPIAKNRLQGLIRDILFLKCKNGLNENWRIPQIFPHYLISAASIGREENGDVAAKLCRAGQIRGFGVRFIESINLNGSNFVTDDKNLYEEAFK